MSRGFGGPVVMDLRSGEGVDGPERTDGSRDVR